MPQGSRPARVGDQIRDELGELLRREVKDPGIGFVTVTGVEVTGDLQIARVYYTTLGGPEERERTRRALERARPFLRRLLAERIRLRRAPELEFRFDESIERADRIERLIQEIHRDDTPDDA
ncbi:MAG TPA: 30S ribosome-binding factor RbfA [Vicinamibacterales bacterium]|nr:30S ribosome-binding factor RbfA [Vicinamibacterales bacterium]